MGCGSVPCLHITGPPRMKEHLRPAFLVADGKFLQELVKLWLGADVVWPLLIPLAKARHTETLVWCSEGYEELQDRSPLCPAQKNSVRSKVDR